MEAAGCTALRRDRSGPAARHGSGEQDAAGPGSDAGAGAAAESAGRRKQTAGAAEYQHWLTPSGFGQQFGPAVEETDKLQAWLSAEGFTEVKLSSGRTVVEFSGSAVALSAAFGDDLHQYSAASGETWSAVSGDVSLPAPFAPLLRGFATLGVQPQKASASKELRRPRSPTR